MEKVSHLLTVQALDPKGTWRAIMVTPHDPQTLIEIGRRLKVECPNLRVRAIDQAGKVFDIL